jgi:hypothetical protein
MDCSTYGNRPFLITIAGGRAFQEAVGSCVRRLSEPRLVLITLLQVWNQGHGRFLAGL